MIPLLTGFGNGRARRRAWPKFARPTLWLYGQQDSFYSIEHSRSNFDAFEKAGGIGEFFEFAVPGGSGHSSCLALAHAPSALAMVAEVVHGAPYRFSDPARFSIAHGGKDRHPYPVPLKVYDRTIGVHLGRQTR
jgi:hypothetical protein